MEGTCWKGSPSVPMSVPSRTTHEKDTTKPRPAWWRSTPSCRATRLFRFKHVTDTQPFN